MCPAHNGSEGKLLTAKVLRECRSVCLGAEEVHRRTGDAGQSGCRNSDHL